MRSGKLANVAVRPRRGEVDFIIIIISNILGGEGGGGEFESVWGGGGGGSWLFGGEASPAPPSLDETLLVAVVRQKIAVCLCGNFHVPKIVDVATQ